MTEPNSKVEPDKLLERLVKYQELQQLAFRRDDVPTANRHFDKIVAATKGLAADPEGRKICGKASPSLVDLPANEGSDPRIAMGTRKSCTSFGTNSCRPLAGRYVAR